MSSRSNGGIIGPVNRPSSSTAAGVWHLFDQQQNKGGGFWPGFVPSVPQVLAGTATVSGTIATVPFTLGFNGGSAVTKVTVTSIPGNIVTTVTGNPPSSPVTVSGLSTGTTYQFQVVATNSVGDSAPSYTNSITTPSNIPIEYLVVAGGGGAASGAGGAGGLLSGTTTLLVGTNYTFTIGAGGAGNSIGNTPTQGSNSSISTVASSVGGGYGGGGAVGGNGGSGGGGGAASGTAGGTGTAGPPRQGYDGGAGVFSSPFPTGGGGGAGAAGSAGSGTVGGNGGIGVSSSITGSSTYYAGGGAGSTFSVGGTAGTGGNGGGGNGGTPGSGSGSNGTVNTGGGAGSGTAVGTSGGNGGSGVIIIAYPSTYAALTTIGVGLTYSVSTVSRTGYRVYTFTAGTGTVSV